MLRVEKPTEANATGAPSERDLHTLDTWRSKLSGLPRTVECPEMTLFGKDEEGTIFKDSGRIEIVSDTKMRFYMHAAPTIELKSGGLEMNRLQR